ncbi:hypothetical protein C8J38_105148 [Rhizobium sp. PP-WC-2G-219]|nr:hypothetical protein C8J38_105148 [Rhizobium sp. PP-WC-2G-219]
MTDTEARPLALWSLLSSSIFTERSVDYYEAMSVLYEPFIARNNGQLFDEEKLKVYSYSELMLPLIDDVIQLLVERMARIGWLTTEGSTSGSAVYRCTHNEQATKDEAKLSVDNDLRNIIVKLRSFVGQAGANISENDDEIEDALLRFFTVNLSSQKDTGNGNDDNAAKLEYWVARFASWAISHDALSASVMERMSGSVLLAEAILEMRTPSINQKVRTDLIAFLDGPLIMEQLGLSGKKNKENMNFVVKKLKEAGATVSCFRHNCDEVGENIHSLLARPHLERTGPTAEALRKREVNEAYVLSVKNNLEHFLKDQGIQVLPATPMQYKSSERYCDENAMVRLSARMPGQRDVSRERDTASISIIMRRRQGYETNNILASKCILLTGNHALISETAKVLREQKLLGANRALISPAVHHRVLSGFLFANFGLSDKRDVSRKQLLASCTRILAVRPGLLDRLRSQIEIAKRDVDADTLTAMLNQPRASEVLMDLTVGQSRPISPGNVDELLTAIRKTAADDVRTEYEDKLSQVSSEAEQALSATRAELQEIIEKEKGERDQERVEFAAQLVALSETVDAIKQKADESLARSVNERDMRTRTAQSLSQNVLSRFKLLHNASFYLTYVIAAAIAIYPIFFSSHAVTISFVCISAVITILATGYFFFDRKFTLINDWFKKRAENSISEVLVKHQLSDLQPQLTIDWTDYRVLETDNAVSIHLKIGGKIGA